MKYTKNPRRAPKLVQAADYYEQACNINVMLIANFLSALNELYPKQFGKTGKEHFLANFMDSVKWLEAGGDSDIREHRISEIFDDMPYVTDKIAMGILKTLSRLASPSDRRVFCRPEYVGGLIENTVLMLATLKEDYGFGEKRIGKVVEKWLAGQINDGSEWLSANVGYESDSEKERKAMIDNLLAEKEKRKDTISVREQIEIRRQLEALKAYQSEVSSRDKPAGAGTPESP